MLKYIFPILIFILFADKNITTYDLIKFEDKYYLANSYNPYSGKVIDYYDNGIKKLEGYLNKGFKDGDWFEFYESGKVKAEINYNYNQASYTSFYLNGNIKSFGMLDNNIKDGLWIQFDEFGNKKLYSYFTKGILDSLVDVYIPLEIIQDSLQIPSPPDSLASFNEEIKEVLKEIKNGEYITYFESGKYLVEFYKDDLLEGLSTIYYENDKKHIERSFLKDKIVGKTYEYSNLGLLSSIYNETLNKDNLLIKNGEYISYNPNETIKEIGSFINGFRSGKWFVFDENSKKHKDIYYYDKIPSDSSLFIIGDIISYYPTGEKKFEYKMYSYLNCYEDDHCSINDGNQHNVEVRNGEFLSFYKDGSLKERGQYADDVKDGFWNEYYISGKIKSNINFVNGSGLYTSYYDQVNSIPFEVGYYIDEKKNGLWSEYDINGELIRTYYYKNNYLDVNHPMEIYYNSNELDQYNKLYDLEDPFIKVRFYCKGSPNQYVYNGIYEEFYINNNLKSKGVYKDGIKFSYWKEFYENSLIKSQVIFDDNGDGEYESYLESGDILSRGNYRSYLKDGKWISYYPNGSIQWVLFYLNDKINPNNLCSNWYENGYKKIEGFLVEYDNEVIWDGKYIEYYDNGIIYLQGNYSFGKKNGNWVEYYPNRMMKNKGIYLDDKKYDKWYYYNENGDLIKTEVYE